MEKVLKLYKYVDENTTVTFPDKEDFKEGIVTEKKLEQAVIYSFKYTANRMGSAPSITAKLSYKYCLDDVWSKDVYAEFNGEKYYIRNTPSSSKSNTDERYEHEIELLSERDVLNQVYFIDAVQGDSDTDVYKSNSTKILFFGDIVEFVARLNASFSYLGLTYSAVIDSGVTSEAKQVSIEDKYISEALQEIFNIYELPYYFVGKVIHVGFTTNAIPTVFRYGHDDALLSISKNNANYKVYNQITGIGSSDNIPYYYPNESDDRSAIEASGKKWITPTQNLMPSIYRTSEGAKQFYEAINNTYEIPGGETGDYYVFENVYSKDNPQQGKVSFDDIKPSITGVTNGAGENIDTFLAFAYDTNDNDEVDDEGNYLHPYFFAKLKKTNGSDGFNLFEQAIEQQPMQISMTSGVCGACVFEIGVGENTNKNTVQVDDQGNLLRDENGDVRCGREGKPEEVPQDRQNDTENYEVWLALKKDNTTYPQLMPNKSLNYRPSTSDKFVILGINFPLGYITAAEKRLDESLIKYMWMNNREKFTFSIKFSRIYFEENKEVLNLLNENARVTIEYNGISHTLYIDNYVYSMDGNSPLPEIDIDLVDTLAIGKNSLQQQLDSVKQDILSSIGGGDFLKQGLKYFLRKDVSDTASGLITFLHGWQSKGFAAGMTGAGVGTVDGAELHADKLLARKYIEVLSLVVSQMFWRGGRQVLSPAGLKVSRVEAVAGGWRLYMETEDGQKNEFTVGAQARCNNYGTSQRYWWRLVTAVGADYIEVSETDCDAGSVVPAVGDEVVQLGHRTDPHQQWAVMDSSFSDDAGRTIYAGIDSYDLSGKLVLREGVDPNDPGRIGLFLADGTEVSTAIGNLQDEIGGLGEGLRMDIVAEEGNLVVDGAYDGDLVATVWRRWNDITSTVSGWVWTRQSGTDSASLASDALWNEAHAGVKSGRINITGADIVTDTVKFVCDATVGTQTVRGIFYGQ